MTWHWEGTAASEDTLRYSLLPDSSGEHHTYAELAPRDGVHVPAASPAPEPGSRPFDIGLTLACIARRVRLCESNPSELSLLDQYLAARVEGRGNPLGGLRQYHFINDDVHDGARTILIGAPRRPVAWLTAEEGGAS